MPTIEIKEIAPCKKEILIEVPQDIYRDEFEKIFKQLGRQVSIPGFRKGKAPRPILMDRYGAKAEEDAVNQAIPRAYGEAIKELKLRPVGNPEIDNVKMEKEKPIRFSATVEHLPQLELKRYTNMEFKWKIVKITDEEFSREIKNTMESFSELESVSGRPAREGDHVIIDYKGTIDGVPFKRGEGKGALLCLGEGSFLPELEQGIEGMSLGDTKEVKVTFPANYQNKELAGKETLFEIILNEIKVRNTPELDDDFAKEHFEEESAEAFMASTRKRLEDREEEEGKLALKEDIFTKVHEANHFDFPDSIVDSQADMMASNVLRQMGFNDEAIQKERERFLDLKKKITPAARIRVITHLISENLKELENLDVTEEELDKAVKKSRIDHKDEAGVKDKEHTDYVRNSLLSDKILDFLIENNNVEKVYIDRPVNISDNEGT